MKQFFGRALRPSYMTLIYFLFYLPIGILIVYSFNDATFSMLWHGFTLNWYQQLFQDTGIWRAAGHSVLIGMLASIIATFLGMLAAVSLYRYRFYGQNLLYGLVFILIITPDIVMGVSLLSLFSLTNVPLGFLSLLIAHITFCIPFVVVIIYSRITGLDKNIFEAAHDLGANEWTILRRVTVPLLLPALISACLLSFTLSFDDVLISYFVSGPAFEILPLKIYSMARLGIKPELNALCAIVFTITILLVATAQLIMRKKQ